jgi:hypothetical protein
MLMRDLWVVAGLVAVGATELDASPAVAATPAGATALVVGEAAYTGMPPLPGCALSAHAVAAALRAQGFTVDEQDDVGSAALYAALGTVQRQLAAAPQAPAFVYYCGYAAGFGDRPFLVPTSANLARPADVLTQGLLAKSLLDALVAGKPATAVLALDAVPAPNGAGPLPLDALTQPAPPPTLGYLAIVDNQAGNTPLPLAAALVPLLHAPTIQSAGLITDAQHQLAGVSAVATSAVHLPDPGLYLAGAPAPVVAAPPPPAASVKAEPLPDEDHMTEVQRRKVQQALAQLGYYDAQPDGVFGPETRAAIRRWQHEQHMPMDGHLTAAQANRLATTWD